MRRARFRSDKNSSPVFDAGKQHLNTASGYLFLVFAKKKSGHKLRLNLEIFEVHCVQSTVVKGLCAECKSEFSFFFLRALRFLALFRTGFRA